MIDRRSAQPGTMFSLTEKGEGYEANCILPDRPFEDEFVILETGSVLRVTSCAPGRYRGAAFSKKWHGKVALAFTGVGVTDSEEVTSSQLRRFISSKEVSA